MKLRAAFIVLVLLFGAAGSASAWAGPPYNGVCNPSPCPPGGNVPAPLNVGSTNQVKNANIGVNGLAVFGNLGLDNLSRYLNFGVTTNANTVGSSGYGIRDKAGTLEFKNSGGSWASLQSLIYLLVGSTSPWTTSGTSIYYNGGKVGVGTASPASTLDVVGTGNISSNLTLGGSLTAGGTIYNTTTDTGNTSVYVGYGGTGTTGLRLLRYGPLHETLPNRVLIANYVGGDMNAGGYLDFRPEAAWPYLRIRPPASTAGRVLIDGQVGIGITNPTQQLDVSGYVRGSQGMCIGSDCRTSWPTDTSTSYLYGNVHTRQACEDAGGLVRAMGGGSYLCQMTPSTCPSGWTKKGDWSITYPRSCTYLYYRAGVYDACESRTTNTGGHEFSNIATESVSGSNQCGSYSCSAMLVAVGCY